MAAADDILRRHWHNFAELQASFSKNQIVVGVDRVFARRWLLHGGTGCRSTARTLGLGIVAVILGGIVGAVFGLWKAFYIFSGLCALATYVGWRVLTHFAIRSARLAAIDDERLFRSWFRTLRLSVLVKSTGEFVWNSAEHQTG